MDGSQRPQVDVEARVRNIKAHMPETYKAIQAKAEVMGREAYAWVRQAIAGKPNTFYAFERGWVVGTPFDVADLGVEMARQGVSIFGCTHVVVWGGVAGDGHGAD